MSATSVTFSVTVFLAIGEECNRRVAPMLWGMDDLMSVVRSIVSRSREGSVVVRSKRMVPGFYTDAI